MPGRICFTLILAALLVLVLPVAAQDTDTPLPSEGAWTVLLYDQATGTVTQVAPSGDVFSEFVLPIPETFDAHSWDIVISPLGNYFAYIVAQVGAGNSPVQSSQLIVYDSVNMSMAINYGLSEGVTQEGLNAAAGALAFSDDGTRLFTSYYVPTDDTGTTYTMELIVLDVTTGQVVTTLGSETLAEAGANAGSAYRAQAIAFQNNVVTVRLEPVFVVEGLQPLALNWDVAANVLVPAPSELTNARDYFVPSAEALLLTYDESLGTPLEEGAGAPANTIQVMNLTSGDVQTVYTSDANLMDALFVQNGERILLFADPDATAVLIERDGTVVQEFSDVPSSNLRGTPAGFLYANPQQVSDIIGVTTNDDSLASATLFTAAAPYTSLYVQDYQFVPAAPTGG